jgi:hypothetical protein
MPTLSEAALALLRFRVEGGNREVNESNLEAYRELARAGIMYPVSGFISGPEYLFRWTDEGWARRLELLGCRRGGDRALERASQGAHCAGPLPLGGFVTLY